MARVFVFVICKSVKIFDFRSYQCCAGALKGQYRHDQQGHGIKVLALD